MPTGPFVLLIDLFLRGGVFTLALLLAGLSARYKHSAAAKAGGLLTLGVAVYALNWPLHDAADNAWIAVMRAVAAGNAFLFYLFASALFDDEFRLRPWHAPLWAAFVAASLGCSWSPESAHELVNQALRPTLAVFSLVFAALGVHTTLASQAGDLVEERRRLRGFVVGAAALYIALVAAGQLSGLVGRSIAADAIEVAGLLALLAAISLRLLRVGALDSLFGDRSTTSVSAGASAPVVIDPATVAAIDRAMRVERLYRREGLTIVQLASHLDIPEYRLRRLINSGMGYRNFNAFLNQWRLDEAKAALADPTQAAVPILTIALDAGFGSLGPFNRAFKAQTGVTPSEFRRGGGAKLADSGIGEPKSKPDRTFPTSASLPAE